MTIKNINVKMRSAWVQTHTDGLFIMFFFVSRTILARLEQKMLTNEPTLILKLICVPEGQGLDNLFNMLTYNKHALLFT